MTINFSKRQGQEGLKYQRLFLKQAMLCTAEACKTSFEKITEDVEWDELAKVVMSTEFYKDHPKVGGVQFSKILLDPMMVWMTIAENHPNSAVREAFFDRAQKHAPLQYHSIAAHFFSHKLNISEALQDIRQAFTEVASDWGVSSILPQLPWFQSSPDDKDVTQFLKSVLGVVGRMKKNRAGDELDNGNEFILRATGWQRECITGWLLIHCTQKQIDVNGASIFEHIYEQNELLAYMVRYYVTKDKDILKQARKACQLGTAVLLFRFGRDDDDFMNAYRAIETEFKRGANKVRNRFRAHLQDSIDIEDWFSEYLEKRVWGALRIVPELTHTDPKRHLYKVNENFRSDKIRQFCNRLKVEQSEAMRSSYDDEDSKPKAEGEDVGGLAPGDHWTDDEYMERANELLENGIPNIRHRIAFLFKHVWGSVTARWQIPDAWTKEFQVKLRYATTKEVTDLFDELLVIQSELGMGKYQYRAHRDDLKARLFRSNAETDERYFRLGRNSINQEREE